jgi:integrase
MFRAILIWAENEGHLAKAPGANIKVAGLKTLTPGEQRDPYSPDQLIKIMKSPLYTGHKSEDCRYKLGTLVIRDGYFWTPLIALFSGMRLGEILQLQKTDAKLENDVWFFDVCKGEEKSLKTASSKRRVPIHKNFGRLTPGGRHVQKRTGLPTALANIYAEIHGLGRETSR